MTKETMNMTTLSHAPRNHTFAALITIAAVVLALCAATASAAAPAPGWTLDNFAIPTNFSAADNATCTSWPGTGYLPPCDGYAITATNVGARPTDDSIITLADSLPHGLTVQHIKLFWLGPGADDAGVNPSTDFGGSFCDTSAVRCDAPFTLAPEDILQMLVYVTVDPGASGPVHNSAKVSGGGAADVTATAENTVGAAAPLFGPADFSSSPTGADGAPETQAGAHPFALTTRIGLNNEFRITPEGFVTFSGPTSIEDLRNVVVDLPLGFLGAASAAPTCTLAQLTVGNAGAGGNHLCPPDTVVGHLRTEPNSADSANSPIWNITPEHGVAAEFGYVDGLNASHVLYARVVPGPDGYVLQVSGLDVPQVSIQDVVTTFYGNPAVHDGSGKIPVAMFANPSHCDGRPLTTTIHMDSWQHPGSFKADGPPNLSDPAWKSASSTSPAVTGCNKLRFDPTISVKPDATSADASAGLDLGIKVPQPTDPNTLATPPLKKGVITLPQGMSVNPSAADGLSACSPAQIELGSASPPTCPDASKVGTVEVQSPLLPGTLSGSVYLATQYDNPFHSLLAGYIVIDDPATGVVVKIPGRLDTDPSTGQITGVFDNNPQLPFSELRIHFFGGPRGNLATPDKCGTYTTTSDLEPWSAPDSGPDATPADSFPITSGCSVAFGPGFEAGTTSPIAGTYAPFVLKLTRQPGSPQVVGLDTTLPEGLLGKLAGLSQCSEAAIASASASDRTGAAEKASPSCPASSQVGVIDVGAGSGTPFYVQGTAYLAGPYKGAPFSLALVTPAVAGPFDLGTVVVRAGLYIDPITAQVTVNSDPIPTIVDGIPLRIRDIRVNTNRPDFTLNPTSCDPMAIGAQVFGTDGATAAVSSRFQAGGCAGLAVAPKLAINLTGKGQTTDDKHPGVHATVSQTPGQANLKKVTVTLPLSLALDPDNAQALCEFTDGSKIDPTCPKGSIVGHAVAHTPILDQPLTGPVYFVKNIRKDPKSGREIRTLPKLVIPLTGENGLRLNLVGTSNVVDNHLVNTFDNIPDAPVSDFTLNIDGGKSGILVVSGTDICKTTQIADQQVDGQNGKTQTAKITLGTPCGLGIVGSSHTSTSLKLTVGGIGAGKVSVSGKGIAKTSRTIGGATTATLTARLSKAAASRLKHHHDVRVKVTVSFTPKGAKKAKTSHKTITIHAAKR
ncbi:hypothetical protein [Baekduia sp.]|jgi:hypothetical protein|uniref:hypothetical protein n=1 Tax=Baekduia sp. TaxID=2600305 RepID=UPI002E080124|nr:hypothetical protein [Baekduia sp.]